MRRAQAGRTSIIDLDARQSIALRKIAVGSRIQGRRRWLTPRPGEMGPGPRGRTPRERCIPATAMSSRDTLAIGESAWARGWVDGAGPSARLRLDLKLVGLGHRSPQPAAVTAVWPGLCGLARSLQPDRAPQQRSLATAALVGLQRLWVTAALAGATAGRRAQPAVAGQARPTMVPRTAEPCLVSGRGPFYRGLLRRDSSILFLRIRERPMTFL
jgi:hypothetical protein